MSNIFSKATQTFDFTKPNVMRKFAYRVKYIIRVNGGLIMFFFFNLRIRFFKISWINCEQNEKNQFKKKRIDSSALKVS